MTNLRAPQGWRLLASRLAPADGLPAMPVRLCCTDLAALRLCRPSAAPACVIGQHHRSRSDGGLSIAIRWRRRWRRSVAKCAMLVVAARVLGGGMTPSSPW